VKYWHKPVKGFGKKKKKKNQECQQPQEMCEFFSPDNFLALEEVETLVHKREF